MNREHPPRDLVCAPPAETRRADELTADLDALEDGLGLDLDVVLATAAEIERSATAVGDAAVRMRARLLRAGVWLRQGHTEAAAKVLWEVTAWSSEHDHRPLRARGHRMLAWIHFTLGDMASALEHSVSSVDLLDGDTPPQRRASYLMALANALSAMGSFDAARERFEQAEQLAMAGGDVQRHLQVLNNLAYNELDAGEPQRAWTVVERLQLVATRQPSLRLSSMYLDTIAQIQIALGRYADAEETAQASVAGFALSGLTLGQAEEGDSVAEALLTLAVAQRHLGAVDAARATLDRCGALCEERDLATLGVRVLQERAELYAASGDPARAFATYKAFHLADKELVSQQREAQARTRQAMFETAEARQEAERFREQARRDPLTGLGNRRYVDEHLPALLRRALDAGRPLVAALVDLDHFKRINDTCSHEVGDQVLVAVAGLLAATVADATGVADGGGFAARMGGEEFLVVLTGTSADDAVARLDDLRNAIATHPWQPVTGDLPVTVSIGVAGTVPDSTQAELLAQADACLYAAKRDGRNRVSLGREVTVGSRRQFRDRMPPTGTG